MYNIYFKIHFCLHNVHLCSNSLQSKNNIYIVLKSAINFPWVRCRLYSILVGMSFDPYFLLNIIVIFPTFLLSQSDKRLFRLPGLLSDLCDIVYSCVCVDANVLDCSFKSSFYRSRVLESVNWIKLQYERCCILVELDLKWYDNLKKKAYKI